jgi:hypothetical protein
MFLRSEEASFIGRSNGGGGVIEEHVRKVENFRISGGLAGNRSGNRSVNRSSVPGTSQLTTGISHGVGGVELRDASDANDILLTGPGKSLI